MGYINGDIPRIPYVAKVAEKNAGVLVKTIGDELMCRFCDADHAVTAARVIQESLQNRPAENGFKIHVRIGLHMGQALT